MRINVHSGAEQALRKECEGQGEAGHKYVRGMQAQGRDVREQSKEGVLKNKKGGGAYSVSREMKACAKV